MTEEQLTQKIREAVEEAGSLRALGKRWKISAQHLCDLVHGRRRAGERVLAAMGLKRETRVISTISEREGVHTYFQLADATRVLKGKAGK